MSVLTKSCLWNSEGFSYEDSEQAGRCVKLEWHLLHDQRLEDCERGCADISYFRRSTALRENNTAHKKGASIDYALLKKSKNIASVPCTDKVTDVSSV